MESILDFFLHLDTHLFTMIMDYGSWVYGLFFLVIFIETGMVIFPFLPGDSLLFAVGAFCAGVTNASGDTAQLSLWIALPLMILAAVGGDSLNYYFGETIGLRIMKWKVRGKSLVSKKNIDKTSAFFDKNGTKAIIIARFVPIIRTFAPFVARIGGMHYGRFLKYNIIGATAWVLLLIMTGYFFGNLPFVKNNFELAILGIVLLSMIPVAVDFFKGKVKGNKHA